MKKLLITTLIFVLFQTIHAQQPWRAKLFVHFLDSNNQIVTDTVWFGCDSLGAEGYQPGLDVIDTNLKWNKVYSADELIKVQYNTDCANLKTDIRKFDTINGMKFNFYCTGNPVSMSWDTSDFIYQIDSTYRIHGAILKSINGYLFGIDATSYIIGGDSYKKVNGEFIYLGFGFSSIDSISVYPESQLSECHIKYGFNFNLEIGTGWAKLTGLIERLTESSNIYPNPFSDKIYIETKIINAVSKKYSITSLHGIEMMTGELIENRAVIDTSHLISGIYFITVIDNNVVHTKPYKLIKL